MERYKRISTPRSEPSSANKENEIRITTQGLTRNYISYATSLFQDHGATEIVLMAMGRAINKAVAISEILKKRIEGLHQNISLSSSDVTDVWEPLEEGLETLELVRHVSMISITLSTKELDTSSSGYQAPLCVKHVQPLAILNREEGGVRGAGGVYGRGQGLQRRNIRAVHGSYNAGDENWSPGRADEYQGRGQKYVRGGRGSGKGYSQGDIRRSNSQNYNQQSSMNGQSGSYPQRNPTVNNWRSYSQSNTRGYSQPQADARRYNNSQKYNNGYSTTYSGMADQNAATWGGGRGPAGYRGRGRGRGRF